VSKLETTMCGMKLDNPFIIASCPASETLKGIRKCSQHGAGAIIMKSCADYDENEYPYIKRRVEINKRGFWATSSFRREVCSRKSGIALLKKVKESIDTPIIFSVAGLTYDINDWLPLCIEAEECGADMIQLDLFYVPQPITDKNNFGRILAIIKKISERLVIPVIPKLSIELPAYLVAKYADQLGIAGFSLVDSVRVNSPIKVNDGGQTSYDHIEKLGMSSVLGNWQFPITSHYTFVLGKHTNLPICAGGGLQTAQDAAEIIMLGATTVQYATSILMNGYDYIDRLKQGLEDFMDKQGYTSLEDMKGIAVKDMTSDIELAKTTYIDVRAFVNNEKCIHCQRCVETAFCDALNMTGNTVTIDDEQCEGCGLCVKVCKANAIQLKKY
jgi:dihydroorotate dehydrogenase/NAD-dependent dihydropyrimidine dehydrogenase PreA subunit